MGQLFSQRQGAAKGRMTPALVVEKLRPSVIFRCGWQSFQATSQAPSSKQGNVTRDGNEDNRLENRGGGFCGGNGSHGNRLPSGELEVFLHLLGSTHGLSRNAWGEKPTL